MIRAPLGVFSGVAAAAVKYSAGLYPAAPLSGAANGGDDADRGSPGGLGAGVGGGGENGEAVGGSGKDRPYFPTRIATGGLAALGRWRAGGVVSTEQPSGETNTTKVAGEATARETKSPAPIYEAGAGASVAGAAGAVESSSEAGEELTTASTPTVKTAGGDANAPVPADGAGVSTVRPYAAMEASSEATEELSTGSSAAAVVAEVSVAESPAGEANAGAVRRDAPDDLARNAAEPTLASIPGVVADTVAPASGDDVAGSFQNIAIRSSQAFMRAVGDVAAETKAPEMRNEAKVGVAATTDAADFSEGPGEHLCTYEALDGAWTVVGEDLAANLPIEVRENKAVMPTERQPCCCSRGGGSICAVSVIRINTFFALPLFLSCDRGFRVVNDCTLKKMCGKPDLVQQTFRRRRGILKLAPRGSSSFLEPFNSANITSRQQYAYGRSADGEPLR